MVPTVAVVGVEAWAVKSGTDPGTNLVPGPQLLFSFDSVIVPKLFLLLLSAQARTQYTPAVVKAYCFVIVSLSPEPSACGCSTGGAKSINPIEAKALLMKDDFVIPPFPGSTSVTWKKF